MDSGSSKRFTFGRVPPPPNISGSLCIMSANVARHDVVIDVTLVRIAFVEWAVSAVQCSSAVFPFPVSGKEEH